MLKDPVCGRRMNRSKTYITIEYEGVSYSLCCPLCQSEFERAPKSYADPAVGEQVKRAARMPHRGRGS